jgi:zinc metalloprotease ZmpB
MAKKYNLILILLLFCASTVLGQDKKVVQRVNEVDFQTQTRSNGSFDVNSGLTRSRFRQFESQIYRSPEQFLIEEGDGFGWKSPDIDLRLISDDVAASSRHVTYQQTFKGLPVLDHMVRVNMDREGRVSMVLSAYSPVLAPEGTFNVVPSTPSSQAVEIAFRRFADGKGRHSEAKLGIIRPESPVLVWEVMVWPVNEPAEYRVQVDARSGEVVRAINQAISLSDKGLKTVEDSGSDLFLPADPVFPFVVKSKMEREGVLAFEPNASVSRTDGTGLVFDPSPLYSVGVNYGAPYIDANDATNSSLDAARSAVPIRDISVNSSNQFVLNGPFVSITGLNSGGSDVYVPPAEESPSGFQYTRAQSGFEAVNAYYHIDKSQRYVQSLGIQGRQASPLSVNPQGLTRDDSFFFPSSNSLSFGTGGVDDAEDPTVVWHEYAHALLEAVSPGILSTVEGSAFHEGWADYWAASYLRSQVDSGASKRLDWRKLFAWDSGDGSIWTGRTVDHQGVYPQGICSTSGSSCNVHDDGLMWATTMMEVYDQLGRTTTDQLSLLSHAYLVAPVKFSDAAEAVIQADLDYNNGVNVGTLITIFDRRGLVSAGNYAPVIVHSQLPNTEKLGGTIEVEAQAIGVSAEIANIQLIAESGSTGSQTITMTNTGVNAFIAELSLPTQVGTVYYYFRAEDAEGRVTLLPEGAPAQRFQFIVGQDVHPPVITHIPILDAGFVRWPLQLSAVVTDNFSIGAVAVEYTLRDPNGIINSSGVVSLVASGTTFSGLLDIPFEKILKGSHLQYAIMAVDRSEAANSSRFPESGFVELTVTAEGDLRNVSFEATENNQWESTGLWEKGAPTYGRSAAFQESGVVATRLNDAYSSEAGLSILELRPINLGSVSTTTLSFWHYYDTENDGFVSPDVSGGQIWDGGLVQIMSADAPEWTTISPKGGYPGLISADVSNPLAGQAAFGGFSFGWRREEFELPASDNLIVRFVFATNSTNSQFSEAYAGWIIDQVSISTIEHLDNEPPSILEQPDSQVVVSIDDSVPTITVVAEDNVGVVDAFIHWTFSSRSGNSSGVGRLQQDPSEPTRFTKTLNLTLGAEAGDELRYFLELKDPSGNLVRAPSGAAENLVLFRIRDTSNPIESISASGAWQMQADKWRIAGNSSIPISSLNLNPIQIPTNSVEAVFVINHSYQFGSEMAGQVELSENGGAEWQLLIPSQGYPGQFLSGNVANMSGESAFIGSSSGQIRSVFNIQSWAGKQVLLRLVAGATSSASATQNWTVNSMQVVFESEEDQFEVPLQFELLPAFPNPFSDRANLAFTLPEAEEVDIRLYDLLGREVALIQSGILSQGAHRTVVERNNLVAGVYLLRVRAGNEIRVRKLVIVN